MAKAETPTCEASRWQVNTGRASGTLVLLRMPSDNQGVLVWAHALIAAGEWDTSQSHWRSVMMLLRAGLALPAWC